MKKQIIYIDMDGVLVQYPKTGKPKSFLDLPPIEGAIDSFNKLSEKYDVFIASTAPWSNPDAWKDKRLWVEKHLGEKATKRLILTHRKDLLIGDYLIDDRNANGASEFNGELIKFGSENFPNWEYVNFYFHKSYKVLALLEKVEKLKAGDQRVLINGYPCKVDFRIIADDLFEDAVSALRECVSVSSPKNHIVDVDGDVIESLNIMSHAKKLRDAINSDPESIAHFFR